MKKLISLSLLLGCFCTQAKAQKYFFSDPNWLAVKENGHGYNVLLLLHNGTQCMFYFESLKQEEGSQHNTNNTLCQTYKVYGQTQGESKKYTKQLFNRGGEVIVTQDYSITALQNTVVNAVDQESSEPVSWEHWIKIPKKQSTLAKPPVKKNNDYFYPRGNM
ncbi:hypothetical protein MRY82_10370 [bacterium]|nr:hypothetical protein [bacterium]